MIRNIIILLLITTTITAEEATLNCPKEVTIEKEFTCTLQLQELTGTWDVKFDIKKGTTTVAKTYHEEKETWKSAYYYIGEGINEQKEGTYKLKIVEEGNYNATLKLRQDNTIKEQQFSIRAIKETNDNTKEEAEEETTTQEEKEEEIEKEETTRKTTTKPTTETKTIILEETILNNKEETKQTLLYTSTNRTLLDYTPYATIILLLLIITYLLQQR